MLSTSTHSSAFLTGPVFPITIPFSEDQSVDYNSLHSYCTYLVDHGAKNLLVTVGTSRFNLLTRNEMLRVNQTVASVGNENTSIIVSGPGPISGSLSENIHFANEAASSGADGLIVVFPERFYGQSYVIDFFLSIADVSPIPIWIHAVPFRDGFGGVNSFKKFDYNLLKHLSVHPNILGVKEENGDRDTYLKIQDKLHGQISIIGAGGAMRRYLKDYTLGAQCYLVGIESFFPELGIQFFKFMSEGKVAEAQSLALHHEDNFFKIAVEYGWHRSLKAALFIRGLMPIHERSPFPSLTQQQISALQKVMSDSSLI